MNTIPSCSCKNFRIYRRNIIPVFFFIYWNYSRIIKAEIWILIFSFSCQFFDNFSELF